MSSETLGDALPKEMARVRDEVMPAYQECGPAASIALHFMRNDLDAAAQAMAEGDVAKMAVMLGALREYRA